MPTELDKKLRNVAATKIAPEVDYAPLRLESLSFPQQTESGQLTMAGCFRKYFHDFCASRKLDPKTASDYDTIMSRQALPFFDNSAFADLGEDDFARIWDKMKTESLSESTLKVISIVIRGLVNYAYQLGETQTILWGVPLFTPHASANGSARSRHRDKKDVDEGSFLAEQGIRIRRSMSLQAELLLVHNMLEQFRFHGELLAALIIIFLGARTSEATAFSWKHFCDITPGYWALVRYDVSKKDSRETVGGGKTNNAFRLLPVPKFLAELLLERKKLLEELFPDLNIDDLPIACRGVDYLIRCTQREVNQCMKGEFMRAGVDEDLLLNAYVDMLDHPDVSEDCEQAPTAYLGRHQFATAMVACGLTSGEIYTVMGHKEEDENTVKADFSNPDRFRELADKMSRRPTTQFFNQVSSVHSYVYDGTPLHISDDGDVKICCSTESPVRLTLMSQECTPSLEMHSEQFEIETDSVIALPRSVVGETLSIRSMLLDSAKHAWEAIIEKRKEMVVSVLEEHSTEEFSGSGGEIITTPPVTAPTVVSLPDSIPPLPEIPTPVLASER